MLWHLGAGQALQPTLPWPPMSMLAAMRETKKHFFYFAKRYRLRTLNAPVHSPLVLTRAFLPLELGQTKSQLTKLRLALEVFWQN